MPFTAMTRTVYSVPSFRPLMVCDVPVTIVSDTLVGVSQLSAASFHCTLYPVIAEPPSLAGALQEATSSPLWPSWTWMLRGTPGTSA